MANATQLGQTGLQGWREKVADGISQPVANRAPLDEDQVRAVIGAAFFVLAVIYIVKTISAASPQARQGDWDHARAVGSRRATSGTPTRRR